MKIRIDCNFQMEFFLKTHSNLDIQGSGEWVVDEYDLANEFLDSDFEDFDEFLKDYFYSGLNLDDSLNISVNEDDLKILRNFVNNYKEENEY